jgi:ABC-2 type transport system ATP-binding protein
MSKPQSIFSGADRLSAARPARTKEALDFVIETQALTLNYGRKKALNNMTLRVPSGRIHAIVGANGAGKSSLFRVLLGFQSPSHGSARVLGCDCENLSEKERARIGFVNEEHSMPLWLRVDEVVAMQRRLYPLWDEQRYRNIIGNFQVLPEQKVSQLSRGERAGVNLAMAMAQRPELLILDEPTLGLDVVAKRAFLEALMFCADDNACTIIYCSHQMDEIERIADNLIILEQGELKHMSSPDDFCQRVHLWIAEFPFTAPGLNDLPGVLQIQRIDGLHHYWVFDQDDDFAKVLAEKGARRHDRTSVGLDRAVNAFLSRNHASAV